MVAATGVKDAALGILSGSHPFPEDETPKVSQKRCLLCLSWILLAGLLREPLAMQLSLMAVLAVLLPSQSINHPLSAALDSSSLSLLCFALRPPWLGKSHLVLGNEGKSVPGARAAADPM